MSGPQDLQNINKMFGGALGGAALRPPVGPRPTMPLGQSAKPLGDSRVPMSKDIPQRNPGQIQDEAGRRLGVPSHMVRPVPTQTPTQQRTQAPKQAPITQAPPTQAPPSAAPPSTKIQDRLSELPASTTNARAEGRLPRNAQPTSGKVPRPVPMPQSRPNRYEDEMTALLTGKMSPDQINSDAVVKILGDRLQYMSPQTEGPFAPPTEQKPWWRTFLGDRQAGRERVNERNREPRPPLSSADAATPTPDTKPLVKTIADNERAKTEQKPPVTTMTLPPVIVEAPGRIPLPRSRPGFNPAFDYSKPEKPQPGSRPPTQMPRQPPVPYTPGATKPPVQDPKSTTTPPPTYTPSRPTFRGYEVTPPKPEKGAGSRTQAQRVNTTPKGNSNYWYSRIGVHPGDNAGVAQKLREIRAKASNPRTAPSMTVEEDRILAQYGDAATGKAGNPGYLMSMDPAAVAKRMEQYRSGVPTTGMPPRATDRPPSSSVNPNLYIPPTAPATPTKDPPKSTSKTPPKAMTEAEKQAEAERLKQQAIEGTDPDVEVGDGFVTRKL
jgi:hypothetical protein